MTHCYVGAAAPGQVEPKNDNAHLQVGAEGNQISTNLEFAPAEGEKHVFGLIGRAALMSVEVHHLVDGAWLLRHANGTYIGVVPGVEGLGGTA